jgi:ribonuclease BN (tRNA processing enzyme)
MKIVLLGTGTPYPEPDRFGSAILIEAGGEKLLFAAQQVSKSGTVELRRVAKHP